MIRAIPPGISDAEGVQRPEELFRANASALFVNRTTEGQHRQFLQSILGNFFQGVGDAEAAFAMAGDPLDLPLIGKEQVVKHIGLGTASAKAGLMRTAAARHRLLGS